MAIFSSPVAEFHPEAGELLDVTENGGGKSSLAGHLPVSFLVGSPQFVTADRHHIQAVPLPQTHEVDSVTADMIGDFSERLSIKI